MGMAGSRSRWVVVATCLVAFGGACAPEPTGGGPTPTTTSTTVVETCIDEGVPTHFLPPFNATQVGGYDATWQTCPGNEDWFTYEAPFSPQTNDYRTTVQVFGRGEGPPPWAPNEFLVEVRYNLRTGPLMAPAMPAAALNPTVQASYLPQTSPPPSTIHVYVKVTGGPNADVGDYYLLATGVADVGSP